MIILSPVQTRMLSLSLSSVISSDTNRLTCSMACWEKKPCLTTSRAACNVKLSSTFVYGARRTWMTGTTKIRV